MADITGNLQTQLDATWIIKTCGALIFSILMIIVFPMWCCWTPCCTRCRWCSKERRCPFVLKLVLFIFLGGIGFGCFLVATLSSAGFTQTGEGLDYTLCTASRMVDATLSGTADPYFIGMIPTLTLLDEMVANFKAGSQFLNDLKSAIDATSVISDNLKITAGVMTRVEKMMSANQNTRPKSPLSEDLFHKCTGCPDIASSLNSAIAELNGGVASSLDQVRTTVERELTGSAVTAMGDQLNSATAPLDNLKTMVSGSFKPFITGNMSGMSETVQQMGLLLTLAFVSVIGLLMCCGSVSMFFFTCREKKPTHEQQASSQFEDEVLASKFDAVESLSGNPYRAMTHKCACCTWCCSYWYAVLLFFVSGLFTVVTVPLTNACVLMDDLSGKMLDDIGKPLGFQTTGDEGQMMKDMVDKCFNPAVAGTNEKLFNVVFTTNATTGKKETLMESIVDKTKATVYKQFDDLKNKTSSGASVSLNGNANIVALKDMLGSTKMSTMLHPDAQQLSSDPKYNPVLAENAVKEIFASTASCDPFTYQGNTLKGVRDIITDVKAIKSPSYPTTPRAGSCADMVTCGSAGTPTQLAACNAANEFLTLKHKLLAEALYECWYFVDDAGLKCDFMASANSCLKADKTVESKAFQCGMTEYETAITDMKAELNKAFSALDASVPSALTKINTDLRATVQTYVIDKIDTLANGVTCGFIGNTYKGFLDGMCMGVVWGTVNIVYSYTVCAGLAFILYILLYFVWRIAIDNYCAYKMADSVPAGPSEPLETE
eukprot:TRINITY_DN40306_c0_g1_i1.p1 TRINITY_DN40306_c0_g1~~TRINITY_DN40306_c0_g1_i1.p1  ORF type:complete len:866 (+),score=149.90 TRINITY_DN40306_c0_g1_i1:280-2598(+)